MEVLNLMNVFSGEREENAILVLKSQSAINSLAGGLLAHCNISVTWTEGLLSEIYPGFALIGRAHRLLRSHWWRA